MNNNIHNVKDLGIAVKWAGVPKNLWDLPPRALKSLLTAYSIRVDLNIIIDWQKTL